jgi:hypothetical protein
MQVEFELFIRNYILDCATGTFCTEGEPITSKLKKFKRRERACAYILNARKTKREPNWAIPSHAIAAAQTLQLSNERQVLDELGISPWEIDDMRFVRNFIAHKSKEAAVRLRYQGLVKTKEKIDPAAIVVGVSKKGGKNYERWSGFIKGVATRLVR